MVSNKIKFLTLISLILCFFIGFIVLDYADGKTLPSTTNLSLAIEIYDGKFDNDYMAIIEDIHNQIDKNQVDYDYAFNITLLMHYHYLAQDYDYVIDHFEEIVTLLESKDMQVELLHLYSMISSIYLTQERYELAYIYTQKADTLCKQLMQRPFTSQTIKTEYESTLAALKYMKVSILLRLELFDLAQENFEEAENFREEANIRERADIYFNIINYYALQNNYEMVQVYYDHLLALNNKQISSNTASATIYLARLQIIHDEIDDAVDSLEFVSEYNGNSVIIKSKIYDLYSLLYDYYGQLDNALNALKYSYEIIKDTPYNLKYKIALVDRIITYSEQLEYDATTWYKIYRDLDKSTVDTKNVQLMLGQLLDLELEATKEKQATMKLEFVNIILIFIVIIILLSGMLTQIVRKNYEDGLTKIYNRKLFNRVYQRLLRRKQEFYIMMLDIDRFKQLNDTYGHEFGDNVLIDLARKLNSTLPNHCQLYRYGGEEFVVIVKRRHHSEVLALAEHLRQTVENMKWANIDHITVSIGCASFKTHQQDVLSKADEHLYHSKKTGKNKVTI